MPTIITKHLFFASEAGTRRILYVQAPGGTIPELFEVEQKGDFRG